MNMNLIHGNKGDFTSSFLAGLPIAIEQAIGFAGRAV